MSFLYCLLRLVFCSQIEYMFLVHMRIYFQTQSAESQTLSEPDFEMFSTKSGATLPNNGVSFRPRIWLRFGATIQFLGLEYTEGSVSDPISVLGWPHFVATIGGPKVIR
jgi:hypothetical protein